MKTARWMALFLALVIGLSACAQKAPVAVSPTQPGAAINPDQIRDWWNGLTEPQRQFWYFIDIAFNMVLPGLPGEAVPGMTISERAALAARAGDPRGQVICLFLDLADPGHCQRAIRE